MSVQDFEEPTTEEGWEELARPMGWHEFEGYNGPPEQWRDAEAFVRHAWNTTPILRAQNHKLLKQVDRLNRDNGELKSKVDRMGVEIEEVKAGSAELLAMARKARDAGRRDALAEIERKERQAVEEGDPVKFEEARQTAQRLTADWAKEDAEVRPAAPAPADPNTPPAAPAPLAPEIQAFIAANPWFNDDRDMAQVFIAMQQRTARANPSLGLAAQLEHTKKDLLARFPDYFGVEQPAAGGEEGSGEEYEEPAPAPRPAAPARVLQPKQAGGPRDPQGRPRGRSVWEQIADPQERADAKAAFERASKYQPDLTAEEYVAICVDPRADVLDIQRKQRQRAAGGNR